MFTTSGNLGICGVSLPSGAEYIQSYCGSSRWPPFRGSASWNSAAPLPKLSNARGPLRCGTGRPPSLWVGLGRGGGGAGGVGGMAPSLNFVGKTSFALFFVFPCLRISSPSTFTDTHTHTHIYIYRHIHKLKGYGRRAEGVGRSGQGGGG